MQDSVGLDGIIKKALQDPEQSPRSFQPCNTQRPLSRPVQSVQMTR